MTDQPNLFPNHPDRASLQAEAHARPPLAINNAQAELRHWVLFNLPSELKLPDGIDSERRHQLIDCDGVTLRMERHTEFLALTALSDGPLPESATRLIAQFPGELLAGLHLIFRDKISPSTESEVFGDHRLFGGLTCHGEVRLTTDFLLDEQGLVPYLIMGKFADSFARGRLAKRLIDLETYRLASLLALPEVRRQTGMLVGYEDITTAVTGSLVGRPASDLGEMIEELGNLLSGVRMLQEKLRYRIAASHAYYAIVQARLIHLAEQETMGRQTIRGFIEHRLTPAINTVSAFERRLAELSSSVSSAMALARTRIDLSQQRQNQEHLASIEQRAKQQVHLAQTVEGLSVAAITYYFAGLVSTVLKGVPDFGVPDKILTALSIPIIALFVFQAARRARKALSKGEF